MELIRENIYNSFIYQDRYKYYLTGLGNTIIMAFFACLIGVILGLILSSGFILAMKVIGYTSLGEFNFSLEALIIISILLIIIIAFKYIFKKKFNSILFILVSAGIGILICSIMG